MRNPRSLTARACAIVVTGAFLLLAIGIHAQDDAKGKTKNISVDFGKPSGKIRPLHDVHSGPLCHRGSVDLTPYYKEMGFRYVRTHDTPWVYEAAGDIHTIFPDFSADVDDPKSYHFAETDRYIQSIIDLEAVPIFRLGESAELSKMKYYNKPPPDYDKWAKICVNIVRHYNEGWAGGFKFNIRYWEVWNEPDIPNFWTGTKEQYHALYATTARALHAHDAELKVGGPSLAAHLSFLEGFLGHCRDQKLPLDFVSFHSYGVSPYPVAQRAIAIRAMIDKYGFSSAETHLTEWNYFPGDWNRMHVDPAHTKAVFERIHGPEGAAYAGAMLSFLQDTKLDMANYYTGTAFFWGMFDDWGNPYKNFYTFRAFRWLLDTPVRIVADGSDQDAFAVLAGQSEDGASATIMISNLRTPCDQYKISIKNSPWKEPVSGQVFVINQSNDLAETAKFTLKPGEPIVIKDVAAPSVYLIRINARSTAQGKIPK